MERAMTPKLPVTKRMPVVPGPVLTPPAVKVETAADSATEKAIPFPRPSTRDRAHLTLLTGPSAGEVFSLGETETVIGRDDGTDLQIGDAAISRRHARIVRQASGDFVLEDLGSTNGTYVGAEPVARHTLRSGEQIQLGPNIIYRFAMTDDVEERLQRQLFESAIRDPLTGAYNRKYLDERLAAEVAHARRHGTKLALLMLDLDDFKSTNDRHGHLAGDAVLRQVCEEIRSLIRLEDIFARFGGEEFVVITRGDSVENAALLGERLRRAIVATPIQFDGASIPVSVSIGVAGLDEVERPAKPEDLIDRADGRLYRAKQLGRNRVTSADP
jgi:diguanylate cyclase (GGDEF)-like protein